MGGEFSKKKTETHFGEIAHRRGDRTRPHYPEISDAYDVLLDKGFVEYSNSNLLVKEKPYRLTLAGLEALLHEIESIEGSWQYIIGYCINFGKPVDIDFISSVYDTLIERFLPYPSIMHFSHLLHYFELMCKKFMKEIAKEESLVLEILKILTRARTMSVKDIASYTGKDSSTIQKIMQKLTMDCTDYTHTYEYWNADDEDPEMTRLHFIDFLQHCLVYSYSRNGENFFELSTFGILLLVKISRDKNTFSSFSTDRDYDWEEYVDRLAIIFSKKLPLIFGKWTLLKKYLKIWRFYNFHAIFSDAIKRPFNSGGNKELSGSMSSMRYLNYLVCEKVNSIGMDVLDEFDKNYRNSTEIRRIDTNMNNLDTLRFYLLFRSVYLNVVSEVRQIFYELKKPIDNKKQRFAWGSDRLLPLKLLEQSLENEITLVYYINLMENCYNPFLLGKLIGAVLKDDIEIEKEYPERKLDKFSPQSKLVLLLGRDNEVEQLLMSFRNDAIKYFEELQKNINNRFESILDYSQTIYPVKSFID